MSELTLPPAPSTPTEPAPPAPRRRGRGLIVGAIVATVAVIAGAVALVATQGSDEAEAGPLALVFTEGDTHRYRIEQTIELTFSGDALAGATGLDQPVKLETSQLVAWRVTDVDADDVATVRVSVEDASMTVGGMPLPSEVPPPVDLRISPDGRVLSVGGPALGGAALDLTRGPLGRLFQIPGQDQLTPLLPPDGSAAPGDSWDASFSQDVSFGDGSIDVEATSRYVRDETLDGADTAVIATESQVTVDVAFAIADVLDALAGSGLPTAAATGLDDVGDATISSVGGGTTSQTSWVSLDGHEVVETRSSGDFDVAMTFEGVPDLAGTFELRGTFTQTVTAA